MLAMFYKKAQRKMYFAARNQRESNYIINFFFNLSPSRGLNQGCARFDLLIIYYTGSIGHFVQVYIVPSLILKST